MSIKLIAASWERGLATMQGFGDIPACMNDTGYLHVIVFDTVIDHVREGGQTAHFKWKTQLSDPPYVGLGFNELTFALDLLNVSSSRLMALALVEQVVKDID